MRCKYITFINESLLLITFITLDFICGYINNAIEFCKSVHGLNVIMAYKFIILSLDVTKIFRKFNKKNLNLFD